RPGAGDDVVEPVVVEVTGADAHAAGEAAVVGEELRVELDDALVVGRPQLHVGSAAGPHPGDDFAVAAGHVHTTVEQGVIREPAGELGQRRAVPLEHLDVGPATRPGAGNDFVLAVAVEVGGGHVDCAVPPRAVGSEVRDLGTRGRDHAYVAGGGDVVGVGVAAVTDDDVLLAVAVHVAGGDAHALEVEVVEREQSAAVDGAAGAVEAAYMRAERRRSRDDRAATVDGEGGRAAGEKGQ